MSTIAQRTPGCLLACALGLGGCALYQQAAVDAPCIETVEALDTTGDNPLGIGGSRLLALVGRSHETALRWVDGRWTQLTVTLSDATARYVRSRINPIAPEWQRPGCNDRVEVRGRLVLRTLGGELDESIADVLLAAPNEDEAHGRLALRVDSLRGTYRPRQRANLCAERVDVNVLFSAEQAHGALTDVWRDCSGRDPADKEFVSAHWGTRWQNY